MEEVNYATVTEKTKTKKKKKKTEESKPDIGGSKNLIDYLHFVVSFFQNHIEKKQLYALLSKLKIKRLVKSIPKKDV